jgi:hypothetical protein
MVTDANAAAVSAPSVHRGGAHPGAAAGVRAGAEVVSQAMAGCSTLTSV